MSFSCQWRHIQYVPSTSLQPALSHCPSSFISLCSLFSPLNFKQLFVLFSVDNVSESINFPLTGVASPSTTQPVNVFTKRSTGTHAGTCLFYLCHTLWSLKEAVSRSQESEKQTYKGDANSVNDAAWEIKPHQTWCTASFGAVQPGSPLLLRWREAGLKTGVRFVDWSAVTGGLCLYGGSRGCCALGCLTRSDC